MNLPVQVEMKKPVSKKKLQQACFCKLLIPNGGNYTPASRTPWGGREILYQMKGERKVGPKTDADDLVVGESWEISSHPSFPNTFSLEGEEVAIGDLEAVAADLIYGNQKKMPFLVKLLNSGSWTPYRKKLQELLSQYDQVPLSAAWTEGLEVSCLSRLIDGNNGQLHNRISSLIHLLSQPTSPSALSTLLTPLKMLHQEMLVKNLSIQVHPRRGEKGSKSEAWFILDAEPGAGIYLGLKQGVTKARFQKELSEGKDMSCCLHFIPVKAGDTFFLPSGTPHAIGAGLLLLEPQECSETTYRVYDWNREIDGKKRELHLKEAVKSINFRSARGPSLMEQLRSYPRRVRGGANGLAVVESLVKEKEFSLFRISFAESGDECVHEGAFAAFTVIKGKIRVFLPGGEAVYQFQKGNSFMAPVSLQEVVITACENDSILMKIE